MSEFQGPSRVKAVKAAREAVNDAPGPFKGKDVLGLKDAKDAVDAVFASLASQGFKLVPVDAPEPDVVLSRDEVKAAEKVIDNCHLSACAVQVSELVDVINKVRQSDPVGALRRSVTGQYAFAIATGQYLLIDTGDKPRFRAAKPSETLNIKRDWKLVA